MISEQTFKGAVHATAATLLAVLAAYNAMRLCTTGARRHAINIAIYAPLVLFEWREAYGHWSTR